MSVLKLEQFGGQIPAWDAHLLPAGQADYSQNTYLFSGALTGWREPKHLRDLTNSAARYAYRVPTTVQSTAGAYLVFISNVNQGDTVKVGEELYTFTATVINEYDVLLGGSAAASSANLFKAFTLTGTAGTEYGLGTVANPAISDTDSSIGVYDFGSGNKAVITLKAPTFGAAFNTTIVTESTGNARVTWIYNLLLFSTPTSTFQGGTNQTFDNQITGAAKWLEFVDPDTNVMRSPVVDDKFHRYYFASPSVPPQYNTYDRIQANQTPWLLGVPAPGCAPGVNVVGGSDLAQLGFVTSTSVNTDTPGSNFLFLIPITPTGAMTLNDVSFTAETTSDTVEMYSVLYADNANAPGELLNQGETVIGATAGSTATSTFTNPTGLLMDTKYWIGFIMSEAISILKANDVGTHGVKHTATFSNNAPIFAPNSMTGGQPDWNMWGNLTTDALLEARAYVYTWLTEYAEEGPPSPPTIVTGWSNGTWTVALFTPPPDNMGVTRNITTTRIYRTVPSTTGQTTFFFIADVPILTESYIDVIDDATIALNTILPSNLWTPPPEGLQGILSMPNGMAVGFTGNEIWFCEPYRPHAWPSAYVLTTEFPIIGIGVTGQAVVACTAATPYVALGVNPSSMSLTKTLSAEPCISRGSIISTDGGVYYSSTNGLIKVDQNGNVSNTTATWITRERWREKTPSKNIRAIPLSSSYFAYGTVDGTDHSVAQAGFTIELATDSSSFTIWPQPGGHRIGFNGMSAPQDTDIYNVMVDPWTGIGMLIQSGALYYYDFTDPAPTIQPYIWRSKLYQQQFKKNYEAIKVYFSVPPGTTTQNVVRKTSATDDASWNTLDADRYGIIRVFADGNLVTVREIRSSGELLRILSGYKYETWQFEIEGRVLISNIQVATSVKELASV